jgi:hypothetical protein
MKIWLMNRFENKHNPNKRMKEKLIVFSTYCFIKVEIIISLPIVKWT